MKWSRLVLVVKCWVWCVPRKNSKVTHILDSVLAINRVSSLNVLKTRFCGHLWASLRSDFPYPYQCFFPLAFLINANIIWATLSETIVILIPLACHLYFVRGRTFIPVPIHDKKQTNKPKIKQNKKKNKKTKPITICSVPTLGIFKEISFLQGSYDMARMLILIENV